MNGVTMARFLIVEARFYEHLNDMLIEGAAIALAAAGHTVDKLTVPGALELPGRDRRGGRERPVRGLRRARRGYQRRDLSF